MFVEIKDEQGLEEQKRVVGVLGEDSGVVL